MGTYAGQMFLTRELCSEPTFRRDEYAGARVREMAEEQGYHPVGEPRVTWHQITQHEVDLEVAVNGRAWFGPGDWRVRVLIEVSEDAPIGADAD